LEFTVYVLVSATTGQRYVGQTDDLVPRVNEHNSREHNPRNFKSRNPRPWKVLHCESVDSRSAAMAREKWLKSGVGRAWLDRQFGRASPPQAD
jgi:putative endonuclease